MLLNVPILINYTVLSFRRQISNKHINDYTLNFKKLLL